MPNRREAWVGFFMVCPLLHLSGPSPFHPSTTPLHSSMKNWRSKVFASGGLGYVLFDTAAKLLDQNPATNPDWVLLGGVLVGFLAALFHPSPASS